MYILELWLMRTDPWHFEAHSMLRMNYNCENWGDVFCARVKVKSHVDVVLVDVLWGVWKSGKRAIETYNVRWREVETNIVLRNKEKHEVKW